MKICMVGIDFNSAPLEQRELFAFTKSQAADAMHSVVMLPWVNGCVIYSTCNRTEMWLCTENDAKTDTAELFCSLKDIAKEQCRVTVTQKEGPKAVRHLFETACGLHSQIWGEDQIITQIKNAVALAAKEGTAGKVLNKLFQSAVTSAKKIKTQVRFSTGGESVAEAVADKLSTVCGSFNTLRCVVVGNGEMGRMMAHILCEKGADVSMTLRQYKKGVCIIPENCGSIAYDDRILAVKSADIIVSATSSPHYTLHFDQVKAAVCENPKRRIFIDLAVPRDIESEIGGLCGCTLLTVDDFPCRIREEEKAAVMAQCGSIIDYYIDEFERQLFAWSSLPVIQKLCGKLSETVRQELSAALMDSAVPMPQNEKILNAAQDAIEKNADKILFSFRDWMEDERSGKNSVSAEICN